MSLGIQGLHWYLIWVQGFSQCIIGIQRFFRSLNRLTAFHTDSMECGLAQGISGFHGLLQSHHHAQGVFPRVLVFLSSLGVHG